MKMVFVFNSLFEFVFEFDFIRCEFTLSLYLIIPSLPQASKLTNCYSDHLPVIICTVHVGQSSTNSSSLIFELEREEGG